MGAGLDQGGLRRGGKPRRALELLESNVRLRPGAPSHVALARALLTSGNPTAAKASIDRALATPLVSAQMLWTAGLIEAALGNPSGSEAFKARARVLDPRVDAR